MDNTVDVREEYSKDPIYSEKVYMYYEYMVFHQTVLLIVNLCLFDSETGFNTLIFHFSSDLVLFHTTSIHVELCVN